MPYNAIYPECVHYLLNWPENGVESSMTDSSECLCRTIPDQGSVNHKLQNKARLTHVTGHSGDSRTIKSDIYGSLRWPIVKSGVTMLLLADSEGTLHAT